MHFDSLQVSSLFNNHKSVVEGKETLGNPGGLMNEQNTHYLIAQHWCIFGPHSSVPMTEQFLSSFPPPTPTYKKYLFP